MINVCCCNNHRFGIPESEYKDIKLPVPEQKAVSMRVHESQLAQLNNRLELYMRVADRLKCVQRMPATLETIYKQQQESATTTATTATTTTRKTNNDNDDDGAGVRPNKQRRKSK